jgi:trigger factor
MQVNETANEGLKRELQITIEASELEKKLVERLETLKGQVQIKGFRPGKVPVSHLRKIHGRNVMTEIIEQNVNDVTRNALDERGEKPAFQPEISLPEEQKEVESILSGEADLVFNMKYEVMPEFEITDFSKVTLTKQIADVEDEDVRKALEAFAEQNRQFEEKDGKAEMGDRVMIDFVGKMDGEPFENGSAKDTPLVLGDKAFIPGFEEQLVGAKGGDEVVIKVTFPEEYQAEDLAGKEAEFDVTVNKVESAKTPEVNEEMAKEMGFDDLATIEGIIREQLEKDFAKVTRTRMKRDLLDVMDETYDFELPPTLVEQEFNGIWSQLREDMEKAKKTFEDEDTTEEEAKADYMQIAERRVRLGLVISAIGDEKKIEVSEEEMNAALSEHLRNFPGQEQQVYEYYKKNPQALASLRAPIFEEKVVDYILELVKAEEKKVSREELFKDPDAEDEAEKSEKPKKKAKAKSKDKKDK